MRLDYHSFAKAGFSLRVFSENIAHQRVSDVTHWSRHFLSMHLNQYCKFCDTGKHVMIRTLCANCQLSIFIQNIFLKKKNEAIKHFFLIQDYVRIQRDMLFSLEKYFTTDNISSSDETSSYWNTFFIKVTTSKN